MIPRGGKRHFSFRQRWGALLVWMAILAGMTVWCVLDEVPPLSLDVLPFGAEAERTGPARWEGLTSLLVLIVTTAVFVVGARWLVPDPTMRWPVRAFGLALTAMFLLVSFCIGLWKIIAADMD